MRCGVAELQGKDYIALRRLSNAENVTLAEVGQTCERVPAGKHGGTVSDALARLLASGKIALAKATSPAPALKVPSHRFKSNVPDPERVTGSNEGEG